MSLGRTPSALDRGAARLDGEPARGAAHVALLDARALGDPVVARVHARGEVVVRQGLVGQRRAPPDDASAAQATEHRCVAHAVRSHAMGWLTVTRSPSTAMRPMTTPAKGERTSWSPTRPTTAPAWITSPAASSAVGREHPGGRADDEPLGREEVLTFVPGQMRRGARRRDRLEQAVDLVGGAHRDRPEVRHRALRHAGQHAAGTELDQSVTPASASVSRHWRHRTGLHSCADSRLAQSAPVSWARASTFDTTGTSVSRGFGVGDGLAQPVSSRRHERRVERTARRAAAGSSSLRAPSRSPPQRRRPRASPR